MIILLPKGIGELLGYKYPATRWEMQLCGIDSYGETSANTSN